MLPSDAVGQDVLKPIMILPGFQQFGSFAAPSLRPHTTYGELEGTPHNRVHGWIGGDMGDLRSPLDPVFWCHHNMIERCWWEWNIEDGRPNPDDPVWTNLSFDGMFCDGDGAAVTGMTPGLTALMPLLSYQFDDVLFPCAAPAPGAGAPAPRPGPRPGPGPGSRGARSGAAERDVTALREFLQKGGSARFRVLSTARSPLLQNLRLPASAAARPASTIAGLAGLTARTTASRRAVLRAENAPSKVPGRMSSCASSSACLLQRSQRPSPTPTLPAALHSSAPTMAQHITQAGA